MYKTMEISNKHVNTTDVTEYFGVVVFVFFYRQYMLVSIFVKLLLPQASIIFLIMSIWFWF